MKHRPASIIVQDVPHSISLIIDKRTEAIVADALVFSKTSLLGARGTGGFMETVIRSVYMQGWMDAMNAAENGQPTEAQTP